MMFVDIYIQPGLKCKTKDMIMCVDFYTESGLSHGKTKGLIDVG